MERTKITSLDELSRILDDIEDVLDDPEATDADRALCLRELRACREQLDALLPTAFVGADGGLNAIFEMYHHVH